MATYWENSCSFGLRYVSWYKYLIVSLVFSHLGFWSGNLFLIAPFPDLCLLVPFSSASAVELVWASSSLGWKSAAWSLLKAQKAWEASFWLVVYWTSSGLRLSSPR